MTSFIFWTHGKFSTRDLNQSSILLENGAKFMPEDVAGNLGGIQKFNPLIILQSPGAAVWAKRFLFAGATAFIGTSWPITFSTSFEFTKEFYYNLSYNNTLGESMQKARLACRKFGESSWLSYQLYGHPNQRFRFGESIKNTSKGNNQILSKVSAQFE